MFSIILLTVAATALSLPIQPRSLDTRNDLLDGPCRPVTIIFARGTTELGNIGAVVGPFLDAALDKRLGSNVAFQGVDYAATIEGFLVGGNPEGANKLSSLVSTAAAKCPSSQIVLAGYSQGAQIVYKGIAQLNAALASKVRAIVLFGNPNNGSPVPNVNNDNVRTFCHAGDLICEGQAIVLAPHLTYGVDADAAASFVVGRVSL